MFSNVLFLHFILRILTIVHTAHYTHTTIPKIGAIHTQSHCTHLQTWRYWFVCLFGEGTHARSVVAEASGMAQKIVTRTSLVQHSMSEAEGEEREEGVLEEDMPTIEWLQDEVLCIVFSNLDARTLMVSIPHVCKLWRALCQDIPGVHLDFGWLGEGVPVEVLVGSQLRPLAGGDGSKQTNSSRGADAGGWKSGLCELFPYTTSVTIGPTFGDCNHLTDAAMLALADKCRGITHADFSRCYDLMDAAVIVLADKCRGITRVYFGDCGKLTDAALLALADKCPGITHADFSLCLNLTDVAVIALAGKCPSITYVNFSWCRNLTDAALLALAEKCPGITYADFGGCMNLTDVAVIALAGKCPGITHADFRECWNLSDAALLAFSDERPSIPPLHRTTPASSAGALF